MLFAIHKYGTAHDSTYRHFCTKPLNTVAALSCLIVYIEAARCWLEEVISGVISHYLGLYGGLYRKSQL